MLIGYSMPAVSGIYLHSGGAAGQAWLSSDAGTACFDGKPGRVSRLRWRNDAVPAAGHWVAVRVDVPLTKLRVVAFIGLKGIPAGAMVRVYGQRDADGAPTYTFNNTNQANVVQLADGSFAAWLVLHPDAEPVKRIEWRFYNQVGATTWATAATNIDIGELVAMPAVSARIDAGWKISLVDPTVVSETIGMQIMADERQPYRRLPVTLSIDTEARVRAGGLANGMDWARLRYALTRAARCVVIPRWETAAGSGVVDTAKLHESALYGYSDVLGDIEQVRGPWWRWSPAFREIPPAP